MASDATLCGCLLSVKVRSQLLKVLLPMLSKLEGCSRLFWAMLQPNLLPVLQVFLYCGGDSRPRLGRPFWFCGLQPAHQPKTLILIKAGEVSCSLL